MCCIIIIKGSTRVDVSDMSGSLLGHVCRQHEDKVISYFGLNNFDIAEKKALEASSRKYVDSALRGFQIIKVGVFSNEEARDIYKASLPTDVLNSNIINKTKPYKSNNKKKMGTKLN